MYHTSSIRQGTKQRRVDYLQSFVHWLIISWDIFPFLSDLESIINRRVPYTTDHRNRKSRIEFHSN
jgi:hypothetical protein